MSKLFCLKAFFILISICFSLSVPVSHDILEHFTNDFISNECSLPQQIQLPFNDTKSNIQNIFSYLTICKNIDTAERSKEASIICEEILDNLKNVSCGSKLSGLPEISVPFSEHVCEDIGDAHIVAQENDKSFLKRLTDKLMCDIMCEHEFENACQVLLWSHLVKTHIVDFQNSGKLEGDNPDKNKALKIDDTHVDEDSTKLSKQIEVKTGKNAPDVVQTNHIGELAKANSQSTNQAEADTNTPEQNSGKSDSLVPVESDKESQDHIKPVVSSDNLKSSNADVVKTVLSQHASSTQDHTNAVVTSDNLKSSNADVVKTVPSPHVSPTLGLNPENRSKATSGTDSSNAQTGGETSGTVASDTTMLNNKDSTPNTGTNTPQMDKAGTAVETGNDQNSKGIVTDDQVPNGRIPDVKVNGNEVQPELAKDEENEIEKSNEQDLKPNQVENSIGDRTTNNLPQSVAPEQSSTVNKGSETPQTVQGTSKVPVKTGSTKSGDLPAGKETQTQKVTKPKDETLVPETASMEPDGSLNPSETEATIALEKMEDDDDIHQPANKDTEQYNGFYDQTKTKESNPSVTNPVILPKPIDEDEKIYNNEFPSREDRRPDIPLIAGFPEQEDSHFFFYFLSIVIILMAGYLIFHNKQKIIALIVEGRHERRRRSHGVGYKKLETK